ncbi:hypothetical protein ACOMICROBIO_FLGHMIGD_02263 [Vibrio sp. B1FLJ16]|uniref:hypothetical protein n=1 Tax=Vibrio sp. B1FLJ16 TaxID=2751178 RepID=UPI001AF2AC8F|nr:hypothetical protein [Vibrio sp. B1FLJ16]CAD7810981.1 hypothetical protein ACOMICROBIO_FLGHMIGD_02263 [Vibrio sp. B1FLJ16]CAE6913756.1 hypothetical protein ACOMICROBIO_FLGHMIGD_02263 [Vibrio sp. B1FLJ16]
MFLKKPVLILSLLIPALILPVLSANADELNLNELEPMPDNELAIYRGGFKVADDYTINIGLSITALLNGENIFRTNIANLVIENGNLTNVFASNDSSDSGTPQLNQSLVNIIQIGEGNIIGDNITNSPQTSGSQQPEIVSSELLNSSIINIIQNTTDNSNIGLNTLVDIDAQVDGVIQQIRANQQLEDALLNHFN